MSEPNVATRLTNLKNQVAEADRRRAAAEARIEDAKKRLTEIDQQITALGVTPKNIDAEILQLEQAIATELTSLEAAVEQELQAYRALGV